MMMMIIIIIIIIIIISFVAACTQHSGDWLFALPIASCGLKLDDEAVRVAVGLRLGFDLCEPHQCQCGSVVDARGLHSFVCKRAPGRSGRYHALNDLVARGTLKIEDQKMQDLKLKDLLRLRRAFVVSCEQTCSDMKDDNCWACLVSK